MTLKPVSTVNDRFRQPVWHVAALLVALICGAVSCKRVGQAGSSAQPTPAVEDIDPRFAPPTLERLIQPGTSPFHHNPVSWRYRHQRVIGAEVSDDSTIALTTTPERHVVEGVGLLFKAVASMSLGDGPAEYRSFVMLLTPEGMFMSEPNAFDGNLAASADQLVDDLRALGPSWPLPGQPGCRSRERDATLPFGPVRGVETRCRDLLTPVGVVDVTTLWVDSVGFVYRESVSQGGEDGSAVVRRDVLVAGDLVELAPVAFSDDPTPIRPD